MKHHIYMEVCGINIIISINILMHAHMHMYMYISHTHPSMYHLPCDRVRGLHSTLSCFNQTIPPAAMDAIANVIQRECDDVDWVRV